MRIDRAISPPGLIKSATAYSLFLTDQGLYMIKTGRGWRRKFEAKGALNQFAADKAVKRVMDTITTAEQELDEHQLDSEVSARKGSVFVAKSDLSEIELRMKSLPDLRFKAAGKKYRVEFGQDQGTEVETFVALLKA